MALFHTCPVLLALGSIILPGNYGRIIQLVGEQHQSWSREQVLERVRSEKFPEKPSRLASCFAFSDPETARFYRMSRAPNDVLYEVAKKAPDAAEHRSDFNVVQPLPGYPASMEQIAELYWATGLWVSVAGYPQIRCEEVLTSSPLRIVRLLE